MNAIVFFCFRPSKEIFDFAKLLKNNEYDIFVSINDNNHIIPEYDATSITIIKLDETEVKNAGYFNSNHNIRSEVSSRDKAFYYFNKMNDTNYKHLWFIEEDVFIPTRKTISDIDKKYPEGDYMANSYYTVDDNINNIDNFNNINKNFPFVQYNKQHNFYESFLFIEHDLKKYFKFPWLKGMTCAIRVSSNFLKHIDIFATTYKTLIIDEILYPTLSLHNNLIQINPIEFSTIVYRRDYNVPGKPYLFTDNVTNYFYWNYTDIREDYLFHPIKELDLQNYLRIKNNFS